MQTKTSRKLFSDMAIWIGNEFWVGVQGSGLTNLLFVCLMVREREREGSEGHEGWCGVAL
jgi:hypothetical protein